VLTFLQRHQLGIDYLEIAHKWLNPLACRLAEQHIGANRTLLIAFNGSQGSGKTTVSDYLCTSLIEMHGLNAVALSLDDFYLTRSERQALAASVHPLLATRGAPGTHDMGLLHHTLEQLLDPDRGEPVLIPRFDKATDDRRPNSDWSRVSTPVHCVLLEGWCLGAMPVATNALSQPLNDLERDEDADGIWRSYSNEVLRRDFQPLYPLVDQWVMLCAPSFDCVFAWRREQERKLAATLSPEQANQLMNDDALLRFIQHYERITRRCLAELPHKVHHLFELNQQREFVNYSYRAAANIPQ
jgi:D-glycerate 3-kinase